jgi:ribosome maturation factor RimP
MHDIDHLLAPGPARPLLDIVRPVVEDAGFHLVRIRMTGEGTKMIMQIMADNDEGELRIEDCETISRSLSAVLDVESPVSGAYALEVSSPGAARPLTRAIDFERWAGQEAKLELLHAVEGQRRFRGVIEGFEDGEARLEVTLNGFDTPQILGFQLADLAEARLVPDTDAFDASLRASKGKKSKKQD